MEISKTDSKTNTFIVVLEIPHYHCFTIMVFHKRHIYVNASADMQIYVL